MRKPTRTCVPYGVVLLRLLVTVLALLAVRPVLAASYTFTQTGDWNDPATWGLPPASPTPTAGDEIHFGTEGIITVTEDVSFGGPGTVSTWTGGSSATQRRFNLLPGVELTHLAGGTMSYNAGGSGAYFGDGLVNYGTWLHEGGVFESGNSTTAKFTNHGLYFHPTGAGRLEFFNISFTFTNASDGTYRIGGDNLWDWAQGGTFQNEGNIVIDQYTQQTFRDGWGPLGPNLVLSPTSTLSVELYGHTPDDAGLFRVKRDLTLDGDLQLTLASGFSPYPGEQWTIMDFPVAGTVSGSINVLNHGYEATIVNSGTRLIVTFTLPEPAGWQLWLPLTLCAIFLLRRRRLLSAA